MLQLEQIWACWESPLIVLWWLKPDGRVPMMTFKPESEPCFLACFPEWADQFSQTVRPASEKGGEVVPAPEEHRPTEPIQEVLRGLVSRSRSHELQGPFTGTELSGQIAASQPALHSSTESILSLSCPTWFFSGSAAASLLLNHSLLFPFIFTPKAPFTPISP